jgi:hypothetical protein
MSLPLSPEFLKAVKPLWESSGLNRSCPWFMQCAHSSFSSLVQFAAHVKRNHVKDGVLADVPSGGQSSKRPRASASAIAAAARASLGGDNDEVDDSDDDTSGKVRLSGNPTAAVSN